MQKNYATSCTFNKTCMFKRDYSFSVNGTCLGCKFCYKYAVPGTKLKLRLSSMAKFEENISPNLYKVPITISKFCDPNYSEASYRNSIDFAERVLSNNGQIIWRSAIISNAYQILSSYNRSNIQFQGRVITAPTVTGDKIKSLIAPKFNDSISILNHLEIINDFGYDTAIIFDPLIIGLNDADLYIISHLAKEKNIKKIIIKQLFSTDYFKAFLLSHVGRDCAGLLCEKVGPYWTYRQDILMTTIYNVMKDIGNNNISFSVCWNKGVNALINDYNNCCQFENPCGLYRLDRTGRGMYPGVIDLRVNNVA